VFYSVDEVLKKALMNIPPKDPVIKPIQAKSMPLQNPDQKNQKYVETGKPCPTNEPTQQPTPSQPQQSMPMSNLFTGKWDQYVGQAKSTWGKLTDDEILKSEGNSQKLAGLVEQRYAITRDIADSQVKKFIESCKTPKA
jgi:uncharacterized protein YjbJ (UPF0337 family)